MCCSWTSFDLVSCKASSNHDLIIEDSGVPEDIARKLEESLEDC
jgi:hypothetical protein